MLKLQWPYNLINRLPIGKLTMAKISEGQLIDKIYQYLDEDSAKMMIDFYKDNIPINRLSPKYGINKSQVEPKLRKDRILLGNMILKDHEVEGTCFSCKSIDELYQLDIWALPIPVEVRRSFCRSIESNPLIPNNTIGELLNYLNEHGTLSLKNIGVVTMWEVESCISNLINHMNNKIKTGG